MHTSCPSHGCICAASLVTNTAIGRCSDQCDDLSPCTGFGSLPRHPVTMCTDADHKPTHDPFIKYRVYGRECYWESTPYFNQYVLPHLREPFVDAHVHVLDAVAVAVPDPRSSSPCFKCWFCQSPEHLRHACPLYKKHKESQRVAMLTAASSNPGSDSLTFANVLAQKDLDDLNHYARVDASRAQSQLKRKPSRKRTLAIMQCPARDRPGSPGTPPGSPPPSPPRLDSSSSSSSTPAVVGAVDSTLSPGFTDEEAQLFEQFSAARRVSLRRAIEKSTRGYDRNNCDRHR